MKYLLSRDSLRVVNRLAVETTLCAFDFDGTLAPIVAHPDQAGMRHRTEDLLRRLALLYPCVVISGRARADVLDKLRRVHVARVLGNHGAETETTPVPGALADQWQAALELEFGLAPGLWIENKGISLAVHYRQSTRKAETRRRILAAAGRLRDAQVFGGKQVVNIVAGMARNKGDALGAERDRLKCNWVLYVGDDDNDEDAFALGGNTIPVRIGRRQRSHARYYLRTQVEIDGLLELLVRLRTTTPGGRDIHRVAANSHRNSHQTTLAPRS